jgi:hypothetical protein
MYLQRSSREHESGARMDWVNSRCCPPASAVVDRLQQDDVLEEDRLGSSYIQLWDVRRCYRNCAHHLDVVGQLYRGHVSTHSPYGRGTIYTC